MDAEREPVELPRECGSWPAQVRRLTGTAELPLGRDVWFGGLAERFPLSLDALRNASAPVEHAGARRRLRLASLRLVRGQPLTISVLGASLAAGSNSAAPYSRFLQQHFVSLGFNVTVHNLAKGSTTSEYPIERVIPFRREINESDVIIIDYSINDQELWESHKGITGKKASKEGYGLLLQTLLQLPKRPAVLEFAARSSRFGGEGSACRGCTEDISDFFHGSSVQKFGLPVVSFPDATCHDSMPFWFYEERAKWLHPNATTHDLIARIFLGVFALEGEAACAGTLGEDHPWFPLELEEHTRCLAASPLMSLDFGICRENFTDAIQAPAAKCQGASRRHDAGWSFSRDLPRKPLGWLADPAAPPGSLIVFPVKVSQWGWIRLDFLATYENIGSIQCWLPGTDPAAGCVVDARISVRASSEMSAYLGAGGSGQGRGELSCRTRGGKFKLLGIASC